MFLYIYRTTKVWRVRGLGSWATCGRWDVGRSDLTGGTEDVHRDGDMAVLDRTRCHVLCGTRYACGPRVLVENEGCMADRTQGPVAVGNLLVRHYRPYRYVDHLNCRPGRRLRKPGGAATSQRARCCKWRAGGSCWQWLRTRSNATRWWQVTSYWQAQMINYRRGVLASVVARCEIGPPKKTWTTKLLRPVYLPD